MILCNLLATFAFLLSIQLKEFQSECIPDGGDCTRDCECCGESTGTICIQRAKDRVPKCFQRNCEQVGHICSDNSECCLQICKSEHCILSSAKPNSQDFIIMDLLHSTDDIKAVIDLNGFRTILNDNLAEQNDTTTTMKIITVGDYASIITVPSRSGYLKYLVMHANDGTNRKNEENNPTSFKIF